MADYDRNLSIELFDLGNQELYRSENLPAQLLKNGIEKSISTVDDITGRLYKTIIREAPTASQLKQATEKGCRYVLDLDDKTKEDLEKGLIKLSEENGRMKAQFRLASGKYGKKIDVTKEVYSKGIDPVQMSNAMQMKALQDQLNQIQHQITVINASVNHVIEGLQNDRIGLYYSGVRLYLESRNIADPEMKRLLIAQSLRALSDATYQLIFEIKADIKYLNDGEYKKERGNQTVQITNHILSIDQSFMFIHRAMLMRAAIYCSENELPAMASVLNEYSGFIKGVINKNAKMLAQCDNRDTGLSDGIWQSRGTLRLDAGNFAKRLSEPNKMIYIELTGKERKDEE